MQARRLSGRVALVTGAARGIGRGIADRLAAEGACVWYTDIDGADAAQAAADGPSTPEAPAVGRGLDITDRAAVDRLVDEIDDAHGRFDILINNAGILGDTPTADLDEARLRQVLDVNLTGALSCILASVDLMARPTPGREGGRILNIASIMALYGSRDSAPYSAAKAALANLTRCLACDYADKGITVNAIAPGFIDTRMALLPDGSGHEHDTEWFKTVYLAHRRLPLGRAGKPADIAGPAFFLCSDDSAYVTGQVLLVDGGVSATF